MLGERNIKLNSTPIFRNKDSRGLLSAVSQINLFSSFNESVLIKLLEQ